MTDMPPHKLATSFPKAGALGFALTKNDRALSDLKGKHKGRTIFVLGNGPSVQSSDLDKLAGAVCIATNRFYLAYDHIHLRPAYLVAAGSTMLDMHAQELMDHANAPVLTPFSDVEQLEDPKVMADAILFHRRPEAETLFQPNPFKGFGAGAGVTVYLAMQLAAWLGAARIVLYGVDLAYAVSEDAEREGDLVRNAGERNHFIDGYREPGELWREPDRAQLDAAMAAARAWSDAKGGVPIVNATHGGALTAFERVNIADEITSAPPEVLNYFAR